MIYLQQQSGYYIKREYDENGNLTYQKSSIGYWGKNEYDDCKC